MQNWWDTDEPISIQGGVVTKPADPTMQYKVASARNQAAASGYDPAKAAADIAQSNASAQASIAQAQTAGANLKSTQIEAQTKQADLAQRRSTVEDATKQLIGTEQLFRNEARGGFPYWLGGLPPTSGNQAFNTAGNQLVDVSQGLFRVQGQGSQDQREFQQKMLAVKPSSHQQDSQNQQVFDYLRLRLEDSRKALGLPPVDWEAEISGRNLQKPPTLGGERMDRTTQFQVGPQDVTPQQQTASRDRTKTVEVPRLKAVGQQLSRMIAAGVGDDNIRKFMRDAKLPPAQMDTTEQVLQYRQTPQFQAWKKANPKKSYPIDPQFWQQEVPLAGGFLGEQQRNDMALSPGAAFASNVGRGVTADHLDNLAGLFGGDTGMVRSNMAIQDAEHPYAALGGQIAGQGLLELGGGALPGVAKAISNPWVRRAADAAYGGAYGHGAADDNASGGNILAGAASNMLGGMAGRGLQRGVGNAMTGVKDETLKYLNNEGISLTPGQIFRPSDSTLGRAVSWTEDRLRGLPGTDATIASAQRRGVENFNATMFRQGADGAPITATGEQGVEQLGKVVSDAYRQALNGVTVAADPVYTKAIAASAKKGNNLKLFGDDFKAVMGDLGSLFDGGKLTGENIQAGLQLVKQARATGKGQPGYIAYARELKNVENALVGMVGRQAPDVLPALNKANALNARASIIRKGVKSSVSQKNDALVSPIQLNQQAIANATKYGGEGYAASTKRPFFDLTNKAMQAMPGDIPDSGTAGRNYIIPLLGAGLAAGGEGVGAFSGNDNVDAAGGVGRDLGMLALASTIPYSKTGGKLIQKAALAERPLMVDYVGQLLKKYPWLAGALGGIGGRGAVLPGPYTP